MEADITKDAIESTLIIFCIFKPVDSV